MGDLKSAYGSQYEMIIYCNKGQRELNGKRETDVWSSHEDASFKRVVGLNQVHQNEKPLNLIKKCILKSSNEEDIVLDPFIGGGYNSSGCKRN